MITVTFESRLSILLSIDIFSSSLRKFYFGELFERRAGWRNRIYWTFLFFFFPVFFFLIDIKGRTRPYGATDYLYDLFLIYSHS